MSVDDNNISGLPKRTLVLILSIVVIILFVVVVFIIPNFQYIGGTIGINPPVVAKVNGQVLTVNDLINFNCNKYPIYDSKCKTNYMGQLQNFINYTIEYQYLESHKQLPSQKEIYSKISGEKFQAGNQLYDYYYQKLVLDNIEYILLKHASGYIFLANYAYRSLVNNSTMNSKKNIAKKLINSWYKSLNNRIGNVQNLYNKAFNYYSIHHIISYVTHYSNVSYVNYGTSIGYLSSSNVIDILNMRNNSISKIYDYYSNNVPVSLGGYIGYYYFVVSQNVRGKYIDYNSMINNLRSKSNIVIY